MAINSNKKQNPIKSTFIILIAAIALVALAGLILLTPRRSYIEGMAEAKEFRVSSKVPGRIEALYVEEGQRVRKGDTLGRLSIPDVMAKLMQAEAAESAAAAQNTKVDNGARWEQVKSAYEMWQKAKAGLELAEKSYKRVEALWKKGVVTSQKFDEASANLQAMAATEKAAKYQYDMAKSGAQWEDKAAAGAMVQRAKGAVDEVTSYVDESILISPIDGEVSEIFPMVGELVGTGAPIMNIMDIDNMYVCFNVREDYLGDLTMGHEFTGMVPALGKEDVSLKVNYLANLGTYAAWKATKTTGQYDLKTFEVRAKPTQKIENFRPGMTVVIKKKD